MALAHPAEAYIILFVTAILENIFPPAPGDTVTVFGAYLVGRGVLKLWPVILSTFLGSTIGFMGLFALGWRYGRRLLLRMRWMSRKHLRRAEALVQKRGLVAVALNRFIPGVRSLIGISAGILRVPTWKALVATSFSVFAWNGLLIYAGLLTGENWDRVLAFVRSYNHFVMGAGLAIGILVGVYVAVRHLRNRRRRELD